MKMVIADRRQIRGILGINKRTTSQLIMTGLLICLALILPVEGQQKSEIGKFDQAQIEFDNGNYLKAAELSRSEFEKASKTKNKLLIIQFLDIFVSSQIYLGNYADAKAIINETLKSSSINDTDVHQRILIYQRFALLHRAQNNFAESVAYSKKALSLAPNNRDNQLEYHLNIGWNLFSLGYDVSAIIWLEKAEKLVEGQKTTSAKLDVYRILSLAWSNKLNYQKALRYAEKRVSAAENSQFKHKYRQALFDLAMVLSSSGQKQKEFAILQKGLNLSLVENNAAQTSKFLSFLLLNSLHDGDLSKASNYLQQLEKNDTERRFNFEILLGKAVISGFKGQSERAEKWFLELEAMNSSGFILPYWKIAVAERNADWHQVIKLNEGLLELTLKENFREDLPDIYLNFAKAYFHLNQTEKSLENLEKVLAFIEEIRNSEDQNLTLSLFETYHSAYRLLAQIKLDSTKESFELADFLKARLLKDKISNSPIKTNSGVSLAIWQKLEELSFKYITDQSVAGEIDKYESQVTSSVSELDLIKPDLTKLGEIPDLNNKAVVSYFFTLDKKLLAFVWEKDKPLKRVNLSVSENDIEVYAKNTAQKIKNLIFFKRDGKNLYDKLFKPLNLSANHVIIIPDKSLWKIPFQALSSDGERYLIEEKTISYAPSVSILLEQLKNPKPTRKTLQAFANSNFDNRVLQHVNAEASSVSEIYNSKPQLNATVSDFESISNITDILHFSMHAQVDNEQPLESFLGFRKFGKDDGRLTVEEILKIKLKKDSLVFLASCDTNNVLSGEGLVSLAWAMMGSGATTVISAQWEASDKSTEVFTKSFYSHYKQGISSAEALKRVSLEMIKNKSSNMHEPYYWAEFTVNGDYR